jgi:hypothetical protein
MTTVSADSCTRATLFSPQSMLPLSVQAIVTVRELGLDVTSCQSADRVMVGGPTSIRKDTVSFASTGWVTSCGALKSTAAEAGFVDDSSRRCVAAVVDEHPVAPARVSAVVAMARMRRAVGVEPAANLGLLL